MKLTLNYSVWTVIYTCTHPCNGNNFTHSLYKNAFIATENTQYLNGVLLKSKNITFRRKKIFNPEVALVAFI